MINLLIYVFVLLFLIIVLSTIFTIIITQKIKRSIPKFGKTTVLQDAEIHWYEAGQGRPIICLLYTSPSPRDMRRSRMPSSA